MSLSLRGAVWCGVVSMVGTLLLVVLLAVVSPALAGFSGSLIPPLALGFVLGAVLRFVAGFLAGRAARYDGLDLRGALLTALAGLLVGYVVFEVLDALAAVAIMHREYAFRWQLGYGVIPWLVVGGLGALYAWRRTDPASRRETRAQRRAAEREIY